MVMQLWHRHEGVVNEVGPGKKREMRKKRRTYGGVIIY
jgi:hypothetical protein